MKVTILFIHNRNVCRDYGESSFSCLPDLFPTVVFTFVILLYEPRRENLGFPSYNPPNYLTYKCLGSIGKTQPPLTKLRFLFCSSSFQPKFISPLRILLEDIRNSQPPNHKYCPPALPFTPLFHASVPLLLLLLTFIKTSSRSPF